MSKASDIQIRARLDDRVTPALRRLSRRLWWFQYGGAVLFAASLVLMVLVVALAFALGRVTA